MYVLNQNQKNFITSNKIKKLMAVLDISAEDLCKNTGIDFHDFSEALNGNKKFNINQQEAVFHSVKNAVDDNFKFADNPQIHEDINGYESEDELETTK